MGSDGRRMHIDKEISEGGGSLIYAISYRRRRKNGSDNDVWGCNEYNENYGNTKREVFIRIESESMRYRIMARKQLESELNVEYMAEILKLGWILKDMTSEWEGMVMESVRKNVNPIDLRRCRLGDIDQIG